MARKPKIKILTETALGLNPMVDSSFVIPIRKSALPHQFKIDGDLKLPVELEMEKEDLVKVYTKSENRLHVANLSNGAKSLYLHIVYEIPYGKDYIEINFKRYMQENNISSLNTYKAALQELHSQLFICPSVVKGIYWINPRLFFAGNRVTKYPKNVIISQ